MGIKFKILFGFLILAGMLAIAGVWSVIEVRSIGESVEDILDGEYKSMTLARNMKMALEREDSGLLISMFGKKEEGIKIITSADSLFRRSIALAKIEVNISEERQSLKDIEDSYNAFTLLLEKRNNTSESQGNLDWYFEKPHSALMNLIAQIDNYMARNDKVLYDTSIGIVEKSRRAVMPGIVAVIAALVFVALFQSMVTFYFINPIIEITKRVRNFTSRRIPYDYKVETKDEINDLNEAVDILCSHVIAEEN